MALKGAAPLHALCPRTNGRGERFISRRHDPGRARLPLADVAVSTSVESTNGVPLVVERAMWWPGDGNSWHEAHNSSGAIETGVAGDGERRGRRG